MLIQAALLAASHAHPLAAVTLTLPVAAEAVYEALGGESAYNSHVGSPVHTSPGVTVVVTGETPVSDTVAELVHIEGVGEVIVMVGVPIMASDVPLRKQGADPKHPDISPFESSFKTKIPFPAPHGTVKPE